MRTIAALASSALLLASCSSGGASESGTIGTAPGGSTPTPTPVPTPTPTPTGTLATGEIRPAAGFVTSVASLEFTQSGVTTANRVTAIAPAPFAIGFNAAAGQYSLSDSHATAVFGAAQLTGETSVPDFFPRVEFARRAAAVDDFLVIFKAPNATPAITPRYGAYGAWQHNDIGTPTRIRLDYFNYGAPTPAGSMPHSGTVHYRITGTANFADDTRLFFAQSDTVVTVNFAAGTVSGVLTLGGTDFFGDNTGGLIGFRLPGTISGSGVEAPIDSDIAVMVGHFRMQFLGPNAEELAIVYEGNDTREAFAGAAIGMRQD